MIQPQKQTANEPRLSENVSENMSEAVAPNGKISKDINVMNGGRTWARTKDPLIKSQRIVEQFQRAFRDILALYPLALPRESEICRNAPQSPSRRQGQLILGGGR